MKRVLLVFGTRPEAIKMAPLVLEFKKYPTLIETRVCVSAQHRMMLDQVLDIFDIVPNYDLDIMKSDQDLYDVTNSILNGIKPVLLDYRPDMVFVHGDTTTAFATALSAFYSRIPVAHVEAGLRSGDIYSPWPEEANRRMISQLAHYHFAPTVQSRENLLSDHIDEKSIYVTGNTVIDALAFILETFSEETQSLDAEIRKNYHHFTSSQRFVLITGHRRENFGEGLISICEAIKALAMKYPDTDFVYPVHPNPHVQAPVNALLSKIKNIYLIKPMEYRAFVYLMSRAYLILTDSGGMQEEAPSLGKPVLVMREKTERPEALASGGVKLVGTEKAKIISEVSHLLEDQQYYKSMRQVKNPYGDGTAASTIVKAVLEDILL